MQQQFLNSVGALRRNLASRFAAILAMTGLLLLSACNGAGSAVTENSLPEPGKDGTPPTLTTVTIQPDGYVALGQSVRIDLVASEALMMPLVTINGVEAEVTGGVREWRAVRKMNEGDTIGEVSFSIVYQDISGELGQAVSTTTNGSAAEYCAEDCPKAELGPLEGKWRLEFAGFGPNEGDDFWWNTDMDPNTVDIRACWFDDLYEFDADGSFRNVQGTETWLEPWQGGAEGCGAPVAPHDGSNNAIFQYDVAAETLKLTGQGAYLGLPKAVNDAELAAPGLAPGSVTYNVYALLGDSLTVTIYTGGGWWKFELTRISNYPVVGKWKLAQDGGAGVGPAAGDTQWWNTDMDPNTVDVRACWFDDIYHIGDDGSFQNYLGAETWLETWQGVVEDRCGVPVAPHDGSATGAWTYDDVNSTLMLDGRGSFLGLPKAVNGQQLQSPDNAPDAITYQILELEGDTMTVTLETDPGVWWTFKLERVTDTLDLAGQWQLDTDLGAGVGPAAGDTQWWNTDMDPNTVDIRACWFDDIFNFGRDGSFANEQGGETWLETWQGVVEDSCGSPVPPHDGSARAIYEYDATASTLKIYGTGAHLGLAKAVNGQQLQDPANAPESITYQVLALDGDSMTVTLETDAGVWWTFNLVRASSSPLVGNWKMDTDGGAGVGPAAGDLQWWNTNMDPNTVDIRACWFDDVFHFGVGGTFQNFQDGETWLETWQGVVEDSCGAPVAPHDGSSAGRFAYDDVAQELTILGRGSHVGIPKAVNGQQLQSPVDAPDFVTYEILNLENGSLTVTLETDAGVWWTFKLAKE